MLSAGRQSALSVLEVLAKFWLRRAKLKSDAMKRAKVRDQHMMVHDADEKQYMTLSQGIIGLRNTYAQLYDKLQKNFDKLQMEKDFEDSSFL